MELNVIRVCYGKDSTSLEDREYRRLEGGPVGCVADYEKLFRDTEVTKIVFWNKDKTEIEQELFFRSNK